MFRDRKTPERPNNSGASDAGKPVSITLLTVVGARARMEGKFDITESIQIDCEVGGELKVGGKLVIGEKGAVSAEVQTVDAIIMGQYEGNMTATGNVEIAKTGRVTGNIRTDSLVILKGGFFNGNIRKMDDEQPAHQVVDIDEERAHQQLARDSGGRGTQPLARGNGRRANQQLTRDNGARANQQKGRGNGGRFLQREQREDAERSS